jgi:hypothetical protein
LNHLLTNFQKNHIHKRRIKIKIQANLKCSSSTRILSVTLAILLGCSCAWAQEKEIESCISVYNSFEDCRNLLTYDYEDCRNPLTHNYKETEELSAKETEPAPIAVTPTTESQQEKSRFAPLEDENEWRVKEDDSDGTNIKDVSNEKNPSQAEVKEKFHWKPALIESGVFLGLQHGFRLTQEKTRRELGGPFFRDWGQSIKNLRGWEDGDNFFTNYIAHPGQGGITGRIFINNSDMAKKQEFGKSKKYWESRFKAMAWSAVWSTQFELGPISEANIGNVGLRQKNGHSTMAYVDLVMTPVAGTGLVIAEDAVDKYFLRNWLEKKTANKFIIRISRSLFTPTTSIANLLRRRPPWSRDNR